MLVFGTFRVVAVNSERAHTGMSSEALGVSVAPSFFQSCVSDGKTAKMEDVMRFKVNNMILFYLGINLLFEVVYPIFLPEVFNNVDVLFLDCHARH